MLFNRIKLLRIGKSESNEYKQNRIRKENENVYNVNSNKTEIYMDWRTSKIINITNIII